MTASETGRSNDDLTGPVAEPVAGNDIRDPYPEFARCRASDPVRRQESPIDGMAPSYVVYRHDDVMRVLRDHETFSSAAILDGMADVWGRKIIVGMDPPEHQRHRALVSSAFRQRTLARWEDSLVGRVVHHLIDGFAERGRVDLVTDYTFAFPAKVTSGVLGLPETDYLAFQRWALGILSVTRDWDLAVRCSRELTDYLVPIVEARRLDPRDDLVSDLVTAELDGNKLDEEEIFSFLRMLLPAGIETTFRSSGNLLHLLLTHPDQLDAVRDDRSLIPQAIEEALRFETPVLITNRITTRPTALSGVDLPAGVIVTTMLGSANRDPDAHPDPDTFDIFRDPKQHLAFGTGPHLCIGMHLARMETRVALNALFDRLPNLRLDHGEAERRDSHIHGDLLMRSPNCLPIVWD